MELRFCKWIILGLLSSIFALAGTSLFAQEAGQNSDEHVTVIHTYNIRKIYSHRLGYRIDFQDYEGSVRTIYAKISWFANAEVRDPKLDTFEVSATMNYLRNSADMPSNYMTMQYKNGKLISLMIYVDEPNYGNNSIWMQIPPAEDIDSKFDIKTVTFSDPPAPAAVPQDSSSGRLSDGEEQVSEEQVSEEQS